VSHFSIGGTFQNNVIFVTQETDCDLDSESGLFYLRVGTAIGKRRCCQKYASPSMCYLLIWCGFDRASSL